MNPIESLGTNAHVSLPSSVVAQFMSRASIPVARPSVLAFMSGLFGIFAQARGLPRYLPLCIRASERMRDIHGPIGPVHGEGDGGVVIESIAGPDTFAPDDIVSAVVPSLPCLRPRCHTFEERPVGPVCWHYTDCHGRGAGAVFRVCAIVPRVANSPRVRRCSVPASAKSGRARPPGQRECRDSCK